MMFINEEICCTTVASHVKVILYATVARCFVVVPAQQLHDNILCDIKYSLATVV